MSDALISVIIPVYNVELYLNRCVESVVQQTYRHLEIVLVDDGSPDNCPAMCDAWAEKDSRVMVIHKENGGLSDARNAGIAASHGAYITLVDSDDYIHPDMLEQMLYRLCNEHADMAICNHTLAGDWNFTADMPLQNEVLSRDEAFLRLVSYHHYSYYEIACAKLYKRALFDKVQFPVGKCHEDIFTAHWLFSQCEQIVTLQEPFYYYVKNESSIVHTYSLARLDAVEALLDRFDFFYKRRNKTACHQCLWRIGYKLCEGYKKLPKDDKVAQEKLHHFLRECRRRVSLVDLLTFPLLHKILLCGGFRVVSFCEKIKNIVKKS